MNALQVDLMPHSRCQVGRYHPARDMGGERTDVSKSTRTAAFCAGAAFAAAALVGTAAAQTYSPVPRLLGDSNPEGIHVAITPYGWLAGVSGTIFSSRFPTIAPSVSLKFGDLVNSLQFAAMLGGQIDAGNWHGRVDLEYLGLSKSSQPITLLGGQTAAVTQQTFFGTGTVGYTVVASNIWELEPYIGVRGFDVTNKLNFPPIGSLPTETSTTNGWVDPILGAQAQYRISSFFYALLGFDIGGFGVGSQFESQTTVSINMRFTHWLLGVVGFRYMYLDYVSDRYKANLNFYGPVLGLTFAF